MKRDLLLKLPEGEVTAANAAALSGKLSQMANGVVYSDDGTYEKIHDRKLDALEDIIEAANGKPVLAAYWYRNEGNSLTVEPEEAEIVRLIYAKYLEPEMRLTTVVRWLNDHGYRRISRGIPCPFNWDFAARVLDNPFYCGKIVYFRRANRGKEEKDQREEIAVRGKQEAIIPEEMWERAQAKRRQGAVRHEKDEPYRISMLSGLVKCPMCGAGLVVKKSKRVNRNRGGHYKPIHYYACRYYRKSEGQRCGFHHTYNQKKLDGAVMEILGQLTRTEEFQKAFAEAVGDSSSEETLEG